MRDTTVSAKPQPLMKKQKAVKKDAAAVKKDAVVKKEKKKWSVGDIDPLTQLILSSHTNFNKLTTLISLCQVTSLTPLTSDINCLPSLSSLVHRQTTF